MKKSKEIKGLNVGKTLTKEFVGIFQKISKLDRYDCDIEISEEDGGSGFLTTQKSKNGQFVKWDDIEKILNKITK